MFLSKPIQSTSQLKLALLSDVVGDMLLQITKDLQNETRSVSKNCSVPMNVPLDPRDIAQTQSRIPQEVSTAQT